MANANATTSGRSERLVLTREQVAEWLQVRPRQLDRLGVPCIDLGHKTKRYLATDVQEWLEGQRKYHRRVV